MLRAWWLALPGPTRFDTSDNQPNPRWPRCRLSSSAISSSSRWCGGVLRAGCPTQSWHRAERLYLAFGVLPVLVPIAVGALEPVTDRSRLGVLTAVGAPSSAGLMYAVVRGNHPSHHIA